MSGHLDRGRSGGGGGGRRAGEVRRGADNWQGAARRRKAEVEEREMKWMVAAVGHLQVEEPVDNHGRQQAGQPGYCQHRAGGRDRQLPQPPDPTPLVHVAGHHRAGDQVGYQFGIRVERHPPPDRIQRCADVSLPPPPPGQRRASPRPAPCARRATQEHAPRQGARLAAAEAHQHLELRRDRRHTLDRLCSVHLPDLRGERVTRRSRSERDAGEAKGRTRRGRGRR